MVIGNDHAKPLQYGLEGPQVTKMGFADIPYWDGNRK
jgi:hypothetical protein